VNEEYLNTFLLLKNPLGHMAEFIVAKIDEIPNGTGKVVFAGDKPIALFNINGTFYAIDNTCAHRGGPLGEGDLGGTIVTCPWHGWQFDVTTGVSPFGPTVEKYEVKLDSQTQEIKVVVP